MALVGTIAAVVVFVGLGDMLGPGPTARRRPGWLVRVALIEGLWAAVPGPPGRLGVRQGRPGVDGVERLGPSTGIGRHAVDGLVSGEDQVSG